MKAFRAIVLTATTTLCAVAPAVAQNPALHSNVGFAAKVSTLGAGADVAFPVFDRANVRAGFSAFSLSHDFDNDGITLAASLQMRSFSAYFDWFAFGGSFHVSPGVMLYNGNKVSAVATVPAGRSFDLGDLRLVSSSANPVNGTATIRLGKKVAPSIVMGWGNIVPHGNRRWSIPVELGIVYSSAPTTTLALGGNACLQNEVVCRSIATEPILQAEVVKERANMNSDLSPFKILPVVSVGFSYKF